MNTLPHVVIVGAGFGGMEAARRLASAPVRITLIDQRNYHLFQPLLYQVAIAGLSPAQIAYPVRPIFRRQKNLTFQMGEVLGVDFDKRFIKMGGSALAYDYLLLSIGGRTNFFGLPSVEQHALQLKNVESAVEARNHMLQMFERASREPDVDKRRALLTFVVVGGGPTGVETAGALSELIRLVLSKDYPHMNLSDVRVLLLEAGDYLMANYPDGLRKTTYKLLRGKHVDIQFGAAVTDFDGRIVTFKDGTRLPAHTLIWTAGVKAAALADRLGVEQAGLGRVRVEPTLQLPRHAEVYVVGDAAYVENGGGRPLPMLATVAVQEAKLAAGNIRRALQGQVLKPFHYKDPGLLATIGRNAAVARLGGFSFSGLVAWLIWVGLHIYRLIGFRNRLVVLINWAWDYFFYDSQVRLITKE
ncbi:MAG TPA: NAD(P)/FAD-dependent oxidoreductase [Anaerolineales bacterium]|jgi:NADH dehydrogenase